MYIIKEDYSNVKVLTDKYYKFIVEMNAESLKSNFEKMLSLIEKDVSKIELKELKDFLKKNPNSFSIKDDIENYNPRESKYLLIPVLQNI